jgi:hypothetical protein
MKDNATGIEPACVSFDRSNWTTDGNWHPWKEGSWCTTKWYVYVFALRIRNPSTKDGRFNLPR